MLFNLIKAILQRILDFCGIYRKLQNVEFEPVMCKSDSPGPNHDQNKDSTVNQKLSIKILGSNWLLWKDLFNFKVSLRLEHKLTYTILYP